MVGRPFCALTWRPRWVAIRAPHNQTREYVSPRRILEVRCRAAPRGVRRRGQVRTGLPRAETTPAGGHRVPTVAARPEDAFLPYAHPPPNRTPDLYPPPTDKPLLYSHKTLWPRRAISHVGGRDWGKAPTADGAPWPRARAPQFQPQLMVGSDRGDVPGSVRHWLTCFAAAGQPHVPRAPCRFQSGPLSSIGDRC